jgi:hypothetical protein
MARVYAIVGATLWLKLLRLYELVAPVAQGPPKETRKPGGWIAGARGGGSGWMKRK